MRALPVALLGTEGTTAWRCLKPLSPLTGWPSRLVANYAAMKKPDAAVSWRRPDPIVQRTKELRGRGWGVRPPRAFCA